MRMVCKQVINTHSVFDHGCVCARVWVFVYHSFHLDYTEPPITRPAANNIQLSAAVLSSYIHLRLLTFWKRPFSEWSFTHTSLDMTLIFSFHLSLTSCVVQKIILLVQCHIVYISYIDSFTLVASVYAVLCNSFLLSHKNLSSLNFKVVAF